MSIESKADWEGLRRVATVARMTLDALAKQVHPGVTTGQLDATAAQLFADHGARSAPALEYGFPGTVLISVNDEIVHGIPGARRIRAGDIVKIDVTVEKDGDVADAARSVVVEPAATPHIAWPPARSVRSRLPWLWRMRVFGSTRSGGLSSAKCVAADFQSSTVSQGMGWAAQFMRSRRCRIATTRGSRTC